MKPQRRATGLWFLPGRSQVVFQPLGVVGIVVPWNYPLYLAVGPIVAALAAGNRHPREDVGNRARHRWHSSRVSSPIGSRRRSSPW
jgi:hypothetical protein